MFMSTSPPLVEDGSSWGISLQNGEEGDVQLWKVGPRNDKLRRTFIMILLWIIPLLTWYLNSLFADSLYESFIRLWVSSPNPLSMEKPSLQNVRPRSMKRGQRYLSERERERLPSPLVLSTVFLPPLNWVPHCLQVWTLTPGMQLTSLVVSFSLLPPVQQLHAWNNRDRINESMHNCRGYTKDTPKLVKNLL